MFCSNCGNQLGAGLNYCNRCGKALSKIDSEARIAVSGNVSEALAYVGGGGFACFIFIVLILVKNQVPEKTLITISFFYLATLFGICYLILQHVKSTFGKSIPEKHDLSDTVPAVQLPAKNTNQLNEYQEPAISVTEETTRNFEKIPLKNR